MRGRKPRLPSNVTPLRAVPGESAEDVARRKKAEAKALARKLKPKHLLTQPYASDEWDYIAPRQAEKGLLEDFVRTTAEYCVAAARLRQFRDAMPNIEDEVYESITRNGRQLKSRPEVAQYNETWRQWRSLTAMLGISPADQVRLAEIDAKAVAIEEAFDNGEIDAKGFKAALRELDGERIDIRLEAQKAEISQDLAQQQFLANWQREVAAFMDKPENRNLRDNQVALLAFDAQVKLVTSDPANDGLTPGQQLDKARDALLAAASALGGATAGKSAGTAPAAEKPAGRRGPLPPTLASVPAASATETDDGKFAALDRLADKDPEALERALNGLSEAELTAYLTRP